MNRKKLVRYAAWTAGGLAVVLLAAALVVPPLLDTPRISAQIQGKIAASTGAQVRWRDLQLRLLPRPSAALRGVSVGAERVSASAESASVALALLPLLTGDAEITAITLRKPVVAIDLAPAPAAAAATKSAPLDPLALQRDIVAALRSYLPQAVVAVEDGLVRLTRPGMPTLELSQLALNARGDARGLQLQASAASRNWDKLALVARFGYDDLSSDATLDAVGIRPQEWLDWSFAASPLRVGLPNLEVKLRLRGAAGKPLELEVAADGGNVDLARGAGVVRIPGVRVSGRLRAEAHEISIHADELRIGVGRVTRADLRYGIEKGSLDGELAYDLDLAQTLRHATTLFPGETKALLPYLPPGGGQLRGRAALALGEKPSVGVDAALTALDGALNVSARITDFERGPRVQASLGESTVGAELLAWLWKTFELPPSLALKSPIRLTAPGIGWSPKGLELRADAAFPAGTRLGADLSWSKGVLGLRRATITDKQSNAMVSLRSKGGALEGRYSGRLDSRSLAAVLQGAQGRGGALAGDVRFRYDEAARRRATATGALKGERLDLSWLAGKPATLERIEVSADGNTLSVAEAAVVWAGQRATLRGTVSRSEAGPMVDAQIDSPGIVVDELLPPQKPEEEKTEKKSVDPWPLPVTGQITLRADFIQSRHLKVAPVVGTLDLERERAHVEMKEGMLCGISLPFTLEATREGFTAATQIRAAKQPMEQVAKCLSNEKVAITGPADLKADLRTRGRKKAELLHNLTGTTSIDVRNGEVLKFALIGNILAMQNVAALITQGGPKLGAQGFPFRQLSANGRFEKGRFVLQEGVFYSNAIGFGANGWVSLADYDSRLTVLVAPFALANEAVRKLPLLGYVVGGTLTSLPVAVSGDIRDPLVVPLGPGAITSELLGIVTRTLTLPGKLVEPLEQKK